MQNEEIWWVVKCKSPGCMGALLLHRLPRDSPVEQQADSLPENDPYPDWIDTCTACGQRHLYSKPDIFTVRTGRSDPGAGSAAFRRARAAVRTRSRTPQVGDYVSVHGLSGVFKVSAVRGNPDIADLQGIGAHAVTQKNVEWRLLIYLDEQSEANS
jgi:hypothetical protein